MDYPTNLFWRLAVLISLLSFSGYSIAEELESAPKNELKEQDAEQPKESQETVVKDKDKGQKKKKDKATSAIQVIEPTPEYAAEVARLNALKEVQLKQDIKKSILKLSTSDWDKAKSELVDFGKPAIPFLIEAMTSEETPKGLSSVYQNQDPIRFTRQRTLGEVAYETLRDMFNNHSTFKGELPGRSQKEWLELWESKGSEVEFGRKWQPSE